MTVLSTKQSNRTQSFVPLVNLNQSQYWLTKTKTHQSENNDQSNVDLNSWAGIISDMIRLFHLKASDSFLNTTADSETSGVCRWDVVHAHGGGEWCVGTKCGVNLGLCWSWPCIYSLLRKALHGTHFMALDEVGINRLLSKSHKALHFDIKFSHTSKGLHQLIFFLFLSHTFKIKQTGT